MNDSTTTKEEKKYYFIGVVRTTINEKTGEEEDSDSRCFGFFEDLDTAIKAVSGNWTDMNECGYYHYAVIEPHYEGLCQFLPPSKSLWFKESFKKIDENDPIRKNPSFREVGRYGCCVWTTENGSFSNFEGYKECEQPSFAKNVAGWTIS